LILLAVRYPSNLLGIFLLLDSLVEPVEVSCLGVGAVGRAVGAAGLGFGVATLGIAVGAAGGAVAAEGLG
jgi:hypothetical protein